MRKDNAWRMSALDRAEDALDSLTVRVSLWWTSMAMEAK